MTAPNLLADYGFKFHPFPPAAAGVAFAGDLWVPDAWSQQLSGIFDDLSSGSGPKAVTVVGAYGSGKTYVLNWIEQHWFNANRIQPYYIGNPGLAFYGIADEVFRQLGRSEFSKAVWQALVNRGSIFVPQSTLFGSDFHHWLQSLNNGPSKQAAQRDLSEALLDVGLADEEEVSFRFAQIIVGTRDRPYYTFRDFIPRSPTSIVAEQQEPRYFATLVRIIRFAYGIEGVAFLIDEFEDVALGKRLVRRQLAEYFSTLRRLLDTADQERFWLVLSITPEGWREAHVREPALIERFGSRFDIKQLEEHEAISLVERRLANARLDGSGQGLWPFEDNAVAVIQPINKSTPRTLIKIFWLALAAAERDNVRPPIPTSYVLDAERRLPNQP